jgi:phytoene dehydrogenase-like protein
LPAADPPRRDDWQPARLLAPMAHAAAEQGGPAGQRAYLERVLAEDWWRDGIAEHRVVATRIPAEWGAQYHLYRDSMNPVMTARFMREGRLAHRSPHVRGLYLAGSATHPGQWVSFCAVSGILAADRVREDFA